MNNIQDVRALTTNSKLIEFAQFVFSEKGDRDFPDYKKIDLMKIARLVSHVWVLDFRNGLEDGVPFHFSGTHIDTQYGRNLTGVDVEIAYSGEDFKEVINGYYYNVYVQKKTAYTKRTVHYSDDYIDKIKMVETILIPCSHNNNDIDFGLGFAEYSLADETIENQYLLL
ncbi:MAG: PAS domain-containing protein [Alphaproteobacteria bacterium]|nr:PAS domain-containing protein [Alphaproteobacteria bacterium]